MFFNPNVPTTEIPLAILHDRRLNNSQRIAYIVLCRMNNLLGPGNYSTKNISKIFKTSTRSVRENIGALEERGLVRITSDHGKKNVYEIVDPTKVYHDDNTVDPVLGMICKAEGS